jgi:hypothetical protein
MSALTRSKFYRLLTGGRASPHVDPHLTHDSHCMCQCPECADPETGMCICSLCKVGPPDSEGEAS